MFERLLKMLGSVLLGITLSLCFFTPMSTHAQDANNASDKKFRLAIAGMTHGHVNGFLKRTLVRNDVEIVGIFDPNVELHKKYGERYKIDAKLFHDDLSEMLKSVKAEGLAIFSSTYEHPALVEISAQHKVPVMMEKPLAVNMEHALRIQKASQTHGIPVLVNLETTWHPNTAAIGEMVKKGELGNITKIVAMDGHNGPDHRTPPEFMEWLGDPKINGGGALFDFGCYGANLMTWLLNDQRPIAVTAITQNFQPEIYTKVDDEATILVEYPGAVGIIQASWNWPVGRKDLEVYGSKGQVITNGRSKRNFRKADKRPPAESSQGNSAKIASIVYEDPVSHFMDVARGKIKSDGLASLENNMIVTEILDAAKKSAKEGKRIKLSQKP